MRVPDQFDIAVSSLYETVLDDGHWEVALRKLSALFEAPNAALFEYDFVTQAPSNFRFLGYSEATLRDYSAYYHHLDPGRGSAMPAAVGEWLADESMLDIRSPRHQGYVQDFALRNNLGHIGGWKVDGDDARCLFLSFGRPPGAGRFGEAGRRLHSALQPHLQRVSKMRSRLETLTAGHVLAHAALDRLQASVVMVDRSRRVLLVNSHGFRTLSAGRALAINHRRLICQEPQLDDRLGQLIKRACGRPAQGGALRVARRDATADLLLMIVPLPQSHDLAAVATEPVALVVVGDPETEHASTDLYRTLFVLTTAEAALLSALVRGVSVIEWAHQRRISVATVRTQLHALFEKTGVDTQGRLVGLAKSVPPVG